jgi:hypothetical protein
MILKIPTKSLIAEIKMILIDGKGGEEKKFR